MLTEFDYYKAQKERICVECLDNLGDGLYTCDKTSSCEEFLSFEDYQSQEAEDTRCRIRDDSLSFGRSR